MSDIHAKDVKALLLEHWTEIQQRRKQFEAFKVMTELIKDIQKMQEKDENDLDEDEENSLNPDHDFAAFKTTSDK